MLSKDTGCGEQTKKRKRYCNNPSPQYGGSNCYGHGTQIHSKTCPLKGKVIIHLILLIIGYVNNI